MSLNNTARSILRGQEPPAAASIARQPWYQWAIVGIACTGAFMGQIDASIVQLALPALSSVFDASLPAVSWVSLGYLLAFAASLPVFGRLCEMFGRKLLYLGGFLLFSVASVLCGAAPSLAWLVAFRILQGAGGALLGANSIAIIVAAVAAGQRPRAIGIFGAAQAIGICLGPVIGGVLVSLVGWRWVFWVTAPFGLAAVLAGWLILPVTVLPAGRKKFDWRGALLLTPALVLLVLTLNQAPSWGIFSPVFGLSTVATVVLLALLVRHELRTEFPLVDMRLFGSAGFAANAAAVVLGFAMLYDIFFLLSFATMRGYGVTAERAGLWLAVIPVAIGISAPFSDGVGQFFGGRRLAVIAMALCGAAVLALSMISKHATPLLAVGLPALAVYGVGLGLFIAPRTHEAVSAAPAALSGAAGAMLNLMRVLGTSLGVTGAASMLTWRYTLYAAVPAHWRDLAGRPLVAAVEGSFLLLLVFAVLAACVSLVPARRV
jgi:EmrB/QacA subfamily drug resistance transporter